MMLTTTTVTSGEPEGEQVALQDQRVGEQGDVVVSPMNSHSPKPMELVKLKKMPITAGTVIASVNRIRVGSRNQ